MFCARCGRLEVKEKGDVCFRCRHPGVVKLFQSLDGLNEFLEKYEPVTVYSVRAASGRSGFLVKYFAGEAGA